MWRRHWGHFMTKRMLVDATQSEMTRVVVINGNRLEELDFEIASRKQLKGNIYLAKVTRVEPSLQAAFVEYGGNRHGFLAFSEIHPDYYRIPVGDRSGSAPEPDSSRPRRPRGQGRSPRSGSGTEAPTDFRDSRAQTRDDATASGDMAAADGAAADGAAADGTAADGTAVAVVAAAIETTDGVATDVTPDDVDAASQPARFMQAEDERGGIAVTADAEALPVDDWLGPDTGLSGSEAGEAWTDARVAVALPAGYAPYVSDDDWIDEFGLVPIEDDETGALETIDDAGDTLSSVVLDPGMAAPPEGEGAALRPVNVADDPVGAESLSPFEARVAADEIPPWEDGAQVGEPLDLPVFSVSESDAEKARAEPAADLDAEAEPTDESGRPTKTMPMVIVGMDQVVEELPTPGEASSEDGDASVAVPSVAPAPVTKPDLQQPEADGSSVVGSDDRVAGGETYESDADDADADDGDATWAELGESTAGELNGAGGSDDGGDTELDDDGDADRDNEATDVDGIGVDEIGVDEIGGDEAEVDVPRRPRVLMRHYKIQEVIKRRQILLVQVSKEERGNKGAALTTYLSLPGRYCVLMPNTDKGGGISRKITNPQDRKRLKEMLADLDVPPGMAVILRTAGLERSKAEIKRDLEYLLRLWDSIRELTLQSTAPELIYEEANLIKRSIRDLYTNDIDEIQVEGEEGYRTAKDFMRMLMPSHAKRVQLYKDDSIPLFQRYQIESQIEAIHSPVVQLRSGGYIVINPTEALVAIDVNSGRSTRERNIEETALKTNLEAAEEIARQLRLRDQAGLIVIDFIDMEDTRNNIAVERRLKDSLRHDRARIQLGRISPFGLLEMSRQRLRPSLLEMNFERCPHCNGTGALRTVESAALHALRCIEEEGIRRRSSEVSVFAPSSVVLYVLNQKRRVLAEIEQRYGFQVTLQVDDTLMLPALRLERSKVAIIGEEGPQGVSADRIFAETDRQLESDRIEAVEDDETSGDVVEGRADDDAQSRSARSGRSVRSQRDRGRSSRSGRRKFESRAPLRDEPPNGIEEETDEDVGEAAVDDEAEASGQSGPEADARAQAKKRRRGKRGGRRRGRGRSDQIGVGEDDDEASAMEPSVEALPALADWAMPLTVRAATVFGYGEPRWSGPVDGFSNRSLDANESDEAVEPDGNADDVLPQGDGAGPEVTGLDEEGMSRALVLGGTVPADGWDDGLAQPEVSQTAADATLGAEADAVSPVQVAGEHGMASLQASTETALAPANDDDRATETVTPMSDDAGSEPLTGLNVGADAAHSVENVAAKAQEAVNVRPEQPRRGWWRRSVG